MAGIVEFLGWFGAVTVLAGYLLFSTGRIPNGPVYQLFNLVGGLAVAVNVAAHHAVPSTIVNGIWALVAVVVLIKMAKTRRAAKRGVPQAPRELHAEPPATTMVLPVIGPAVHDHEPVATRAAEAEPGLPSAAAPMTESVPVITATIALALVAAAASQQAQQAADEQATADRAQQEPDREPAAAQ